jgi:hypothetical protein
VTIDLFTRVAPSIFVRPCCQSSGAKQEAANRMKIGRRRLLTKHDKKRRHQAHESGQIRLPTTKENKMKRRPRHSTIRRSDAILAGVMGLLGRWS